MRYNRHKIAHVLKKNLVKSGAIFGGAAALTMAIAVALAVAVSLLAVAVAMRVEVVAKAMPTARTRRRRRTDGGGSLPKMNILSQRLASMLRAEGQKS